MKDSSPSRRNVIKTLASAGAVGAANQLLGTAIAQTTSPSSQPATLATNAASNPSSDNPIIITDVAAADKLAGRDYTDAEREMMLPDLETFRRRYRRFRQQKLEPTVEPAAHFDPRLPGTVLPAGLSACTLRDGPLPEYDASSLESLAFATVAQLARLIQARKATSTQLTRMYLDRLKRYGPRLLCVITLCEELAMKQAARADEELAAGKYRGPLHGIPYGAKDLLATKGILTTWGAAPYKEQVFDYDATVIRRLEDAGAVLLAKLSMGELAIDDVWFGGKTRNPWDPTHGSSGSSAGPGSATAAGLVGFSIGSETLGSIISPCVENAVTGLRPTYGRVSRFGAMPLVWTMDKLGPMCRGVEDCALVLGAIHGADSNDPTAADVPFSWPLNRDLKSLRVGFDATGLDWNSRAWRDEKSKKAYQDALDAIRSLVGELKPVKLPPANPYDDLAWTIVYVEASSSFTDLLTSGRVRELARQERGLWPNTFRAGSTVPAVDYLRMMRMRTSLMHEMAQAMKEVDLYVAAPMVGPSIRYTNLTGHPSLVTRCGLRDDGRPRMIEFIGQLYREDLILAVGQAYEQMTDWQRHRPDVEKLPEQPPPLAKT
jgi:Asp-tRNA(Asn)/Glu-tRNA(Gln) amidotransferase A subunit family amidase